jgi:transmembrane sensor
LNDREDRLAHHVRVDLSEHRVDRLWGRVSARLGGPRRARGWVWAGAAVCVAGAAAIIVVARGRAIEGGGSLVGPASVSAWEGAQLETAADALSVTLTDGSSLRVEPRSRVEVGDRKPSALKLVLARGRIACDVTHREGRSFVVSAGGVEVRVVGTRFSVAKEEAEGGARVEVRVERGIVEVRSPGGEISRVEAGHSWSQVTKTERNDPAAGEGSEPGAEPEAAAEVEAPARRAPPAGKAHVAARPAHAAADAREQFEQARGEWRAGRIDAAAKTYQALLTSHPHDPRAGLAAFELGRLRMDKLGDMPGAVQALQQAVALAPGAELREDALARLVAASAAAHDRAVCARSRTRYLTDYPTGVHHRTVSAATCD